MLEIKCDQEELSRILGGDHRLGPARCAQPGGFRAERRSEAHREGLLEVLRVQNREPRGALPALLVEVAFHGGQGPEAVQHEQVPARLADVRVAQIVQEHGDDRL